MHNNRLEKAQGRFTDNESNIDMTRLESGMAFLQVKTLLTMREKLHKEGMPFVQAIGT
jgi:hypothetical protein